MKYDSNQISNQTNSTDEPIPGELAAEPLALCRGVAGHEVLERVEGLPRRDVVTPVVVQRLHLVVLDVEVAVRVPVLDAEREATRVLLARPHEEGPPHQGLGCYSVML